MTERDDALSLFKQRLTTLIEFTNPETAQNELDNLIVSARQSSVSTESILSVILNASPVEVLEKIAERVRIEYGVNYDEFEDLMAPED